MSYIFRTRGKNFSTIGWTVLFLVCFHNASKKWFRENKQKKIWCAPLTTIYTASSLFCAITFKGIVNFGLKFSHKILDMNTSNTWAKLELIPNFKFLSLQIDFFLRIGTQMTPINHTFWRVISKFNFFLLRFLKYIFFGYIYIFEPIFFVKPTNFRKNSKLLSATKILIIRIIK